MNLQYVCTSAIRMHINNPCAHLQYVCTSAIRMHINNPCAHVQSVCKSATRVHMQFVCTSTIRVQICNPCAYMQYVCIYAICVKTGNMKVKWSWPDERTLFRIIIKHGHTRGFHLWQCTIYYYFQTLNFFFTSITFPSSSSRLNLVSEICIVNILTFSTWDVTVIF